MRAAKDDDLPNSANRIANASKRMGMKINAEKHRDSVSRKVDRQLYVRIDNTTLKQVENCMILGGTKSRDGCENDVNMQKNWAGSRFISKSEYNMDIQRTTQENQSTSLRNSSSSVLLYNFETWALKKTQKNRLKVREMTFSEENNGGNETRQTLKC